MTERESSHDQDYPEGSVGSYVRERWGVVRPASTRPYVSPPAPLQVPQIEQDQGAGVSVAAAPAPESGEGDALPAPLPRRVPGRSGHRDGHDTAWPAPPVDAATPMPRGVLPFPAQSGRPAAPPAEVPPVAVPPPSAAPADARSAAPADGLSAAPAAAPSVVPAAAGAGSTSGSPAGQGTTVHAPVAPPVRTSPLRTPGRWTDPGAVAAQEAQRARSTVDGLNADLSTVRLLRPTKRRPRSGWRRAVYVLSASLINLGESPAEVRRRLLDARANQPLRGCYKIAMLSLKGGVGKTTVTATLGATFASLRGDRVVAVDANPDRGTLSQKIPLETSATVRHLLRDSQRLRRYTDVRAYTSQGPSRLEVLASEQDPAVSEAFSEDDYRRTVNLLEHFYNIVLTDCGTGLMHSAMYGVLGVADQLIIVSSGSIDGARSASATMDWLDAHGHGGLVRNAVVVINCVHRSAGGVDLDRVAAHFAARCRSVVRVPFDAHLEEGAELDLDRLEPGTRLALLELAASVADAFDRPTTLS